MTTLTNEDTSEREITTYRLIDKPRELVFQAWTDPKHLANWWGPKGFTNVFQEFDLRPEGNWKFTMHAPDGSVYPNHSIFEKIVHPESIEFRHISGHIFNVKVTFEDYNHKTKLTFKMIFPTKEECEETKIYAIDANEENFDRLEAELAKMNT